jgi:DNA-binding FadR family transcriptional regulator
MGSLACAVAARQREDRADVRHRAAPEFTIAARGSHRARALVEHHAVLEAIATGNADGAREATNLLLKNFVDDRMRIRGREVAASSKPPATPVRD